MLTPGTRLGRYEVVARIGGGGMGDVYRARDAQLGRDVAIKVIAPHAGVDAAALERFEREARLAAGLNHSAIVAIYDAGTEDDVPFIVTELLEGETLRTRLGRGPLRVAEGLDIAVEIAGGLAAAHAAGVIHRDVKTRKPVPDEDGRQEDSRLRDRQAARLRPRRGFR